MTSSGSGSTGPTPVRLFIYRVALPIRRFEHAAASRDVAESVVVRVEFANGHAGWGQTLPREYVTGETIESVIEDLEHVLWPQFSGKPFSPDRTPQSLAIPTTAPDGHCMCAAACALDLACIRRLFGHLHDVRPQVLSALAGRPRPRMHIDSVASGVLGSRDRSRTARQLWLMRQARLVDFKLKLGFGDEIDERNLRVVHQALRRDVKRGRCTLRVDANGAWDVESTPRRVRELAHYGVCVVEQPVFCTAAELADLAGRTELPLMADESLLTDADADALLSAADKVWWNIRLCKNGGLVNSLALARRAAEGGVTFVCGCMVGESSILSAAQRRFLQMGPSPKFVEGNFGRLLLRADLTSRSLRFGYKGKLRVLGGEGLGVAVDPAKVLRYGELIRRLEL